MKKTLIVAIVFLLAATSKANTVFIHTTNTDTTEKKAVKVNSWSSRSIYILDGYFAETKDEIVKQTGQALFDDIKNKCSAAGWPAGLYDSEGEDSVVDAKMNKLKMYKVATYQHKYNGKVFDKYVILEVPYAENADWDTTVKWEGSVYFIIKEADIEK